MRSGFSFVWPCKHVHTVPRSRAVSCPSPRVWDALQGCSWQANWLWTGTAKRLCPSWLSALLWGAASPFAHSFINAFILAKMPFVFYVFIFLLCLLPQARRWGSPSTLVLDRGVFVCEPVPQHSQPRGEKDNVCCWFMPLAAMPSISHRDTGGGDNRASSSPGGPSICSEEKCWHQSV